MKRAIVVGMLVATAAALAARPANTGRVAIKTLSTDASRVTGGDVLVQVTVPAGEPRPRITVGGRDVTMAFKQGDAPHTLVGLVTDLALGRSVIEVHTKTRGLEIGRASCRERVYVLV